MYEIKKEKFFKILDVTIEITSKNDIFTSSDETTMVTTMNFLTFEDNYLAFGTGADAFRR